jgi:hypothetical protein
MQSWKAEANCGRESKHQRCRLTYASTRGPDQPFPSSEENGAENNITMPISDVFS